MNRFFTKEEFIERAYLFSQQYKNIYTSNKDMHLMIHPEYGTTVIFNMKNGKAATSRCHCKDTYDSDIGIGIAWQRYCKSYIEPIFIKHISFTELREGDIFVAIPRNRPAQRYKHRERWTVTKIKTFVDPDPRKLRGDKTIIYAVNLNDEKEILFQDYDTFYKEL